MLAQVLDAANQKEVLEVCTENGIPILADEVYQDNVRPPHFVRVGTICHMFDTAWFPGFGMWTDISSCQAGP